MKVTRNITIEQRQALTYLRSSPETVRQLLVLFAAEHIAVMEQYEATKEALVFSDTARAKAQVLHGRLLALQELRSLFETAN